MATTLAPAQTDRTGATFNTAGEAIAQGKTVQALQTKYATAVAVQKPRDILEVKERCLAEAMIAGEVCYYGWGVGNDRVEGPSVKCAMIAARNWGNAAVDMEPMIETPTSYVFTASFVDLETGFTLQRQFRQSKNWKVYGKMDNERKDDVRFQIGQSKATRNVVLNALPGWLLDVMVDKAKQGVREKLTQYIDRNGIAAARELAVTALGKLGIPQERVEKRLGVKVGAWDVETLVRLKGDIKAIEDGAESATSLFPETEESEQSADPTTRAKAGDPKTNTGHDNAPKPKRAADTEKRRAAIHEMAHEMADGDIEKISELVAKWSDGAQLEELSGDALGAVLAAADEAYASWKKKK